MAAGVGRLVRPLLVNVPSFDPLAFGGVVVLPLSIIVIACVAPTVRIGR